MRIPGYLILFAATMSLTIASAQQKQGKLCADQFSAAANPLTGISTSLQEVMGRHDDEKVLAILSELSQGTLPNHKNPALYESLEKFDELLIEALSSSKEEIATKAAGLIRFRSSIPNSTFRPEKIIALLSKPEKYPWRRDLLQQSFFGSPDQQAVLEALKPSLPSLLKGERDPWVVANYAMAFQNMNDLSRLSEGAARAQFLVKDRVLELTRDPDSKTAEEAKKALGARFKHYEADEEKAIRQGLDEAALREAAREFSLQIPTQTGALHLRGREQLELERRVALPAVPFNASIDQRFGGHVFRQSLKINSSGEVVRAMLDRYFSLPSDSRLRFRPLGSRTEHHHSGIVDVTTETGEKAGLFTKQLENFLSLSTRPGDDNSARYFVTHQREVATYFDTQDFRLRDADIAMRIKEWRPIGETNDPNAPLAHALFLKKNLKSSGKGTSYFTSRSEKQVNLPPGSDQELELKAMQALLAESGVKDVDKLDLKPMVHVDNQRFGFDLMWDGKIKIGFVTVDSFDAKPLYETAKRKKEGPLLQWEIEILPQWQPLLEAQATEFEKFFRTLERDFNGKLDPLPKYQHSVEQKKKGFWPF